MRSLLMVWLRLEYRGARRRCGVCFRAADDIRELWRLASCEVD